MNLTLPPTAERLPVEGFIRQNQLIGVPARKAKDNKPARDRVPGILPISSATLWRWISAGKFPQPLKLGPRVTAWPVDEIRRWMLKNENPRSTERS